MALVYSSCRLVFVLACLTVVLTVCTYDCIMRFMDCCMTVLFVVVCGFPIVDMRLVICVVSDIDCSR